MFLEIFFVLSVFFSAGLCETDEFGCDLTNIKSGSDMLYKDHCEAMSIMVQKNPNYYVDCIQNIHHLNLTGSLDYCSMKNLKRTVTYSEAVLTDCKPENEKEGKRDFCCVITEELKGSGRTGEDKYKMSQDCIKKYEKDFPNSGVHI